MHTAVTERCAASSSTPSLASPIRLTPEQQLVARHREGILLVDAGPGAGKTGTIAERVRQMLTSGIAAHHVLCLTFTRDARREMSERIVRALSGNSQRRTPHVESFHSLGLKLLTEHDRLTYRTVKFKLVEDRAIAQVIRRALNLTAGSEADERHLRDVRAEITRAKAGGCRTPEEFAASAKAASSSTSKSSSQSSSKSSSKSNGDSGDQHELSASAETAWRAYLARCRTAFAADGKERLDFDDLLSECVARLEGDAAFRQILRNRFRHVIVDEYQDVNPVQFRLLQLLFGTACAAKRSLVVVGDCDQSCYRFRGSVPELFLRFTEDYREAQVIRLTKNFRSTARILGAAASVIRHNTMRTPKALEPTGERGEQVRIVEVETRPSVFTADAAAAAADAAESRSGLARATAFAVAQAWRKNLGDQDIAVLVRNNEPLPRLIAEELGRLNVPVQTKPGVNRRHHHLQPGREAREDAEIFSPLRRAILELLRLAETPHDDQLFRRCLAYIDDGKTERSAEQFAREGAGLSLWERAAHTVNEPPLRQLRRVVARIAVAQRQGCWQEVFSLADELPLLRHTAHHGLQRSRMAASAHAGRLATFADFERELARPLCPVRILTAHSAKGLEWTEVFICGADAESWKIDSADEQSKEEERRLFFVAMTRAKKSLHVFKTRGAASPLADEIASEFASYHKEQV